MSKFLLDPFKFQVGGVSYSVTANTTNINEGQTVQFDVLTTGVPNGNTLYWSIEYGANSNSQNTICATAGENGTATIDIPVGVKITTVNFASYGTPGGSCGSFSYGGCHASTSQSVVEAYILNQSGPQSIGVPASNGIFGDPCPGTGKWLYIQATGTNVDFVQGLNGSFTLPTNQVQITAISDLTTEGTETFRLYLRDGNIAGTVLAMSSLITLNDTSITPIISISGPGSANEGDTVTYTITTTNIADGETLYYDITGISSADITDGTLSGSFTVTSNTASISKTLTNDVSQGEGTEYLRIAIAYPISTEYRAFKVTTINDTSVLPPAARATGGAYTLNPGNGWRYHIFRATGTLSVSVGGVLDFWMIASGGGGGGSSPTAGGGGGGGAGGQLQYSETYFGPGPYVVTIPGAGGGGGSARGGRAANTTIGPVPAPYYRAWGGGGGGRGGPHPPTGVPLAVCGGLPGGNGGGGGSPTTIPLTGENYGGSPEDPGQGLQGGWSYYSATNSAGGNGSNYYGWQIGLDGGWSGTDYSGDGGAGRQDGRFASNDILPAYNPLGAIPARVGQPLYDGDQTWFGGGGGGGKAPPNVDRFAGNGGQGGGGGGGTAGPRALAAGRTNTGGGGGGNPGTGGAGGSGTVLFKYDLSR